jgi:hypothetical protein
MKKFIHISTALLVLLFTGIGLNAKNVIPKAQAFINYKVEIRTGDQEFSTCQLIVAVADQDGHFVLPPQAYRPGITTYFFKETGPVTGTRTAVLMAAPVPDAVCPVNRPSDARTGTFQPDKTYLFIINTTNSIPSPNGVNANVN